MLEINLNEGINLKFKVDVSGAEVEELAAKVTINPENSEICYQLPAEIKDGILCVEYPDLSAIGIADCGNLNIDIQHKDKLYPVWNSQYCLVKPVKISISPITDEVVEPVNAIKKSTEILNKLDKSIKSEIAAKNFDQFSDQKNQDIDDMPEYKVFTPADLNRLTSNTNEKLSTKKSELKNSVSSKIVKFENFQ